MFNLIHVISKNFKALNGRTPLHFAAENGHEEIFNMIMPTKIEEIFTTFPSHHSALIIMDQYKNPKDEKGITPLHLATLNGYEKICKSILDVVQEKNPRNLKNETPLDLALQAGHQNIHNMRQTFIEASEVFDF